MDGWVVDDNGQEEAFVPDVNSTMEGHRHHPGRRNEGLCERDGRQKYEEEEEEVVA